MRTSMIFGSLLIAFAAHANAFSCSFTTSSVSYDLNPLSGLRTASKESSTPPTTTEARLQMELCSSSGIGHEDDIPEEDQCSPNTIICLKLLNHKPSAAEPSRVTAVIPIWNMDTPETDVTYHLIGPRGADGIRIVVNGPDYAGKSQHLDLSILCNKSSSVPGPSLLSYSDGMLDLEWKSPQGCPLNAEDLPEDPSSPDISRSGGGLWSTIKFLFWIVVLVLIAYFALGIFYNHQQYSARGWDLIPHRDFWRELPALMSDLVSHMFANLRVAGSGSRGAYSSLG